MQRVDAIEGAVSVTQRTVPWPYGALWHPVSCFQSADSQGDVHLDRGLGCEQDVSTVRPCRCETQGPGQIEDSNSKRQIQAMGDLSNAGH